MTFTPTDYNPYDFANRRHIGPSPGRDGRDAELPWACAALTR